MSSKNFSLDYIRQYDEIFGREKMLRLFSEYRQKAETDLSRTEELLKNEKTEELRLIYHSLRSSSQVFGMMGFSFACQDIEQRILDGETSEKLDKFIGLSRQIYERELVDVVTFLK